MFGDPRSAAAAQPLLTSIALVLALLAAAILIWFLIRRPHVRTFGIMILLAFGFGVFPISAAVVGNLASYQHSSERVFCGTCHVMTPYTDDAADPRSTTLASRHSRNEQFGNASCYHCHQDYGMFSTVATKIGGLSHVYHYYTHYQDVPAQEALETIELYKPYANVSCTRCHSTETPIWRAVDEHVGMRSRIAAGEVMCASAGCHGPVHPGRERREERRARSAAGAPASSAAPEAGR